MKKYKIIYLILFSFFAVGNSLAQKTKSILFVNGIAHLGNGERIDKSAIGIVDGIIKEVFNANVVDVTALKYDTVIDISGKHLYPGFIAPNSNLGLVEIDAVRATIDFDEVGDINPNIRSIVAYNAESKISRTVRTNGVLLAQVVPKGGLISGSSSVVQLDAWNWEDALVKEDGGIHLQWPNHIKKGHEKYEELVKKRDEQLEKLSNFFENARAYNKASYQYERNIRFESMKALFEGGQKLFIHAQGVKEISEAIYFGRKFSIEKMVIVGGYDAWRIPELIIDNKVEIILRRIHSLPMREDEDIYLPFKIPSMLEASGIVYCLDVSGHMGPMQIRNLPFYAGSAMSHGLKEEQAVKSITLNAAKILGINKKYGSIEKGKSATFFISEGNALDMRTNKVLMAMIDGRFISLNNHQKQLYHKYLQKYQNSENPN